MGVILEPYERLLYPPVRGFDPRFGLGVVALLGFDPEPKLGPEGPKAQNYPRGS